MSEYPPQIEERIQEQLVHMKYNWLAREPYAQFEAIADHYTNLFATAIHLRYLVRHYQRGYDVNTEACMEIMAAQIKKAHAYDLGIKLEWPKISS
jgi:hypothetical protein